VGPTALSAGTLEEGLVLRQLSVGVQGVQVVSEGEVTSVRPGAYTMRAFGDSRAEGLLGVDAGRAGTLRRRITEAGGADEK
jgi:hypothetical protein